MNRHKVHEKNRKGEEITDIFAAEFYDVFLDFYFQKSCSYCIWHIFWKYKRTQKWLLSDWNLIQSWPSFLPRVASSRWLNKKTSQHGVCQHCPSLQLCCSARKLLVQVSWEKKKFLYNYIKPLKYSLPQSNYCPPLTNSKMELTINRS